MTTTNTPALHPIFFLPGSNGLQDDSDTPFRVSQLKYALRARAQGKTVVMRIVSWNCCQAFRKKWEYVAAMQPDVLVVAEAESLDRQPVALLERYPSHVWIGDNQSKGLLVLGDADHTVEVLAEYNPEHRYVLPLRVSGAEECILIAVWTQRDKTVGYTQHLRNALVEYEALLDNKTLVLGDFNANTIWDAEHRRDIMHSQNVAWLEAHGLRSVYHGFTGEEQGKESTATHAFRWKADNTFHIDFAFVSLGLLDAGAKLFVPPVNQWTQYSDHGPLVVDLASRRGGLESRVSQMRLP